MERVPIQYKMILEGTKNSAIVYTDDSLIDESCKKQIITLVDHPAFERSQIRVMPDVHAGIGSVIGFTATIQEGLIPSVVGVDIGCGVSAWKLGPEPINFSLLDTKVRELIPAGFNVHKKTLPRTLQAEVFEQLKRTEEDSVPLFWKDVGRGVRRLTRYSSRKVELSLGTLGGGNHFIEVDRGEDGQQWLVIHCGSRNYGHQTATHHMRRAAEIETGGFGVVDEAAVRRDLETQMTGNSEKLASDPVLLKKCVDRLLPGRLKKLAKESAKKQRLDECALMTLWPDQGREEYEADMRLCQLFARFNRHTIAAQLLPWLPQLPDLPTTRRADVESVHNYLDFTHSIVRKGAISARAGEPVIIPLNMEAGTLLGVGKGNPEWNCSAPHGAGRLLSRRKACEELDVGEYRQRMEEAGVWSSCVGTATLDEAPMAYKPPDMIKMLIEPTVELTAHLIPIYNFKAEEQRPRYGKKKPTTAATVKDGEVADPLEQKVRKKARGKGKGKQKARGKGRREM
eukprot:gnl/Dysnectes_brevis/599_a661_1503.p1 GENE.gnl/Dysnectes_brevis/599_a661_1503~~gnl/Dysnectes_brevis/599_a661_1503.p1  ORF type:complete len:512 (+),score=233.66 gnl/Dysnectes_brevis/599_a661_1503:1435-2970(+)